MRLAILLMLTATALSQPLKTKVKFDCTCEDPAGRRFATSFRDLLAKSPRYELTPYEQNRVYMDKPPRKNIVVSVITLDDSVGTPGTTAAISTTLSVGGYLFGHQLQACGLNRIDECAADLLSYLDSQLNSAPK